MLKVRVIDIQESRVFFAKLRNYCIKVPICLVIAICAFTPNKNVLNKSVKVFIVAVRTQHNCMEKQ